MTRPLRRALVAVTIAVTTAVTTALTTTALLVSPSAAGSSPGPDATAAGKPGVGSPSGGDPYYPRDGNGGYDVDHYAIKDTYRPSTGRLSGRTVLTAVADRRLRVFHLDLALAADSVRVAGRPAGFRKASDHELRIRPARPIRAGERFVVAVRYHGFPAQARVRGYGSPFFRTRGEGLAMGQPQIGPWWFAANETPADKATYTIAIRVPRGRQAVSNGELVARRTAGPWTTWHWRMDDPMTTYGAFFHAGNLQLRRGEVGGRPYVYAVSERLRDGYQRRTMRRLQRSAGVVRWLEDQFGSYPFTSIGGVVPGVAADFALETQTRPVYPASWGLPTFDLMVHELAHQWFGNSLAISRWRDIWLNEGFATYAEKLWRETHGGLTTNEWLRSKYRTTPARSGFWRTRIGGPGPNRIFDTPIYERGAMTLAALRNVIGTADHETLLRRWVAENAHGNVTGRQFQRLAEEVSGRDLTPFFREWLNDRDRPADTAANGLR